jgi:hypothetical protein
LDGQAFNLGEDRLGPPAPVKGDKNTSIHGMDTPLQNRGRKRSVAGSDQEQRAIGLVQNPRGNAPIEDP